MDSVYTHKVWNETELLNMSGKTIPYPMLSDATGNIGRLYDVYDSQKGTTLRSTFIIDPEGFIHGMELLTNSIGRSTDEILRQLKAFQNYKSTGEMAPSDWKPGDKTLLPSVWLAGNVWKEWSPVKRS